MDKLSELVRQNASAVLEWKLATGKGNLYVLLKVAGCSLQETNHQILCRWKMWDKKTFIIADLNQNGTCARTQNNINLKDLQVHLLEKYSFLTIWSLSLSGQGGVVSVLLSANSLCWTRCRYDEKAFRA